MDKQLEFITKELIEQAATKIDVNNIPKKHEGKSYAVNINGELYPFKLLIMEAAKIEGFELESANFGSNEANRKGFEEITGFKCVKKENMEYFKLDQIPDFKTEIGKTYIKNSNSSNFYYDTRNKLQYLGKQLAKKINIKVHNNYTDRPNRLAGQGKAPVLTSYILAGFIPTTFPASKDIFVKLSFFNFESIVQFGIDVDINFYNEKNPYLQHRDKIQKDTIWSISVDDSFPANWDELLNLITPKFKERVNYLIDFLNNDSLNVVEEPKEPYLDRTKTAFPLNQILYGPPGTGKTYNSIKEAVRIANPEFDIHQDWNTLKTEYDRLVDAKQIIFTTFHQSMNYEDFVEGIKPQEPKEEGQNITYKVEDGVFKLICKRANPVHGNFEEVIEAFKKDISEVDGKEPITIKGKGTTFDVKYTGTLVFYVQPHASAKEKPWYPVNIANIEKAFTTDNYDGVYNQTYVREIINYLTYNKKLRKGDKKEKSKNNYVLIIDEINRGNVSSIFGELITLIEENKRIGNKEAITVTLPYSKKEFGVPKNLHIIGTMNTADRSVEALDTALRRRFTFTKMPPEPDLIESVGNKISSVDIDGENFSLVNILNTINKRIEILLDRDHLIGHSFFIKVKNEAGLRTAIGKEIMPLMQEYFYGDYGKISLVLGEGFCKGESINEKNIIFAKAKDYDADGFLEKIIYKLNDPAAKTLGNDHYQMDSKIFKNALLLLLNQEIDRGEQEG